VSISFPSSIVLTLTLSLFRGEFAALLEMAPITNYEITPPPNGSRLFVHEYAHVSSIASYHQFAS